MRGLPRTNVACDDPALHVVAVTKDRAVRLILANGSEHEKECSILSGMHGSILDQTTKDTAATDSRWTENADQPLDSLLRLAPYAVAFLSFPRREGQSP
jgi:hypothetical protein